MTPKRSTRNYPKLRSGSAPYERVTNAYQRKLVDAYNSWSRSLQRELLVGHNRGINAHGLASIINNRTQTLTQQLQELGRVGIEAGARVGVGRENYRKSPTIQGGVYHRVRENSLSIGDSVSMIGASIIQLLLTQEQEGEVIDRSSLATTFDPHRSHIASYSGGAWVAIFSAQKEQAQENGDDRRVRWQLSELAQHCRQSDTHWGCPDLEGEYDSWGDLVTVPAGLVTCRGNCRCSLEVEVSPGEWQRGLGA